MKILLKKYKIFIIIYIPIFLFICIICLWKTSYNVVTTGDISNVSSAYIVDSGYVKKGSFNSIFVYSTDNATILQKFLGKIDDAAVVEEESDNFQTFSSSELYQMGLIQKKQSQEASVICAYEYAKNNNSTINIDYSFEGYIVSYLINDNNQFMLGDIITSINGVNASDGITLFHEAYRNMFKDSNVTILRNGEKLNFKLNEYSANYRVDNNIYSKISVYAKYDIDYDNLYPKLTIKPTSSVGPSAGLLQTLHIYNMLQEDDITKGYKIAGTGTISASGNVGEIGGIAQKVITAYKNGCNVFLCPKANEEEGYSQYSKLKTNMKFIVISTFDEALEALLNL